MQGDANSRRYHARGTVRRDWPASQDTDGVVSREARFGWKPIPIPVASASRNGARAVTAAVTAMRFDTRQQVKLGQQMKLAR
ncbi:MAG: hypothetical protein CMJ67_07395 [Planctomycetaceae bacterium]|nr:hypothetical protein [Planctomycetaceae bacterium]